MRLVDLTHPLAPGTRTYPGLPGPEVRDHVSFETSWQHYAEGTEFRIAHVSLVTSTGTYLDAPQHRHRSGRDVAGVELAECVDLPTLVVDATAATEIGPELLPPSVGARAVLFHTGWDRRWGTEAYGSVEHPHLLPATAEALVRAGVGLVGIDSVNIDPTSDGDRPIHTTLLADDVLIVENLTNLAELPERGSAFTAVPLPFRGLPSWPVRAYARVP